MGESVMRTMLTSSVLVVMTATVGAVQKETPAARDVKKWNIPVRHLTVTEVRSGVKGFCGHVDITRAFPADGGTHTDPGPNFPWTRFLNMVRAELAPPPPPEQEKPVTQPADETVKVSKTTGSELFEPDLPAGTVVQEDTLLQLAAIHSQRAAKQVALLCSDPASLADPESHPIVRAVRYALDNPTSPPAQG